MRSSGQDKSRTEYFSLSKLYRCALHGFHFHIGEAVPPAPIRFTRFAFPLSYEMFPPVFPRSRRQIQMSICFCAYNLSLFHPLHEKEKRFSLLPSSSPFSFSSHFLFPYPNSNSNNDPHIPPLPPPRDSLRTPRPSPHSRNPHSRTSIPSTFLPSPSPLSIPPPFFVPPPQQQPQLTIPHPLFSNSTSTAPTSNRRTGSARTISSVSTPCAPSTPSAAACWTRATRVTSSTDPSASTRRPPRSCGPPCASARIRAPAMTGTRRISSCGRGARRL